jgi:PhnB protein
MAVDPIPAGYRNVTPYLVVTGVDRLIPFLEQAFGAKETLRMDMPDGNVGHAEVQIGDSIVMMGEAGEEWPARPGTIHLYVDDVDATYRAALDAGATSIREPADQFYGDRTGIVTDPSGNQWSIATHVEDVPAEEIARRAAQQGG